MSNVIVNKYQKGDRVIVARDKPVYAKIHGIHIEKKGFGYTVILDGEKRYLRVKEAELIDYMSPFMLRLRLFFGFLIV